MRCLLPLLLLGTLVADELHLDDGRILVGEVLIMTEETVQFRSHAAGMRAEVRIPRRQVLRLTFGPVPVDRARQALDSERADLPATAVDKRWALALRYQETGHSGPYQALAREIIALDGEHVGARTALGYQRWQEQWLRPDELKQAQGLIRFRGDWIASDERDRILAREAAARAERAERLARSQDARREALRLQQESQRTQAWINHQQFESGLWRWGWLHQARCRPPLHPPPPAPGCQFNFNIVIR